MTIELSVAWSRRFGDDVHSEESFGLLTVDVPRELWVESLAFARDDLGCAYFDWLTAVDELEDGFAIVAHVFSLTEGHHLLVRTRIPRAAPRLATAIGVFRGASWHERETHEMFGVDFDGHPDLAPLLLPDGFEGHPLRKEFVLAARVAKPWPGAKEPGESGTGAPSRRRMMPPGVPADWGPNAQATTPERPARPRRSPTRPPEPPAAEPVETAETVEPDHRAGEAESERTVVVAPVEAAEPAEPAEAAEAEAGNEVPEPAEPVESADEAEAGEPDHPEEAESEQTVVVAPPELDPDASSDAESSTERPQRRERGIEGGDDV
jgi:NADH-quinone oxidoreductase subunit C